ncbi:MAG: recombination protein RecR [Lentisphaerae bacterium GWF2_45_14]|nr:MAG: recombination protein RecR [Lentisphaerae bacterium GWF2_45_14]
MSSKYPEPLKELVDFLKSLPGIGLKNAERLAFSMLKWPQDKLEAFGDSVKNLKSSVTSCPECGNLSSEGVLCSICVSASRDRSVICVIEESLQIYTIESGGLFKGVYHVLGGKLSPLSGRGAESLTTDLLHRRVSFGGVNEVILALSPDVEGQATSVYISEILKDTNVKVSVLARGLPAGSDISYADSATIAAAISGRKSL